jgi:hypothetical protein
MRFSPSANPSLRSGRLLRPGFCVPDGFAGWALLGFLLLAAVAAGQSPIPSPKKVAVPRRANELTLAGLRPGRDSLSRATALYKNPNGKSAKDDSQFTWGETCQKQALSVDVDASRKIQVIRTIAADWSLGDCAKTFLGSWSTGRGLRVGDHTSKVTQLYGKPDSLSPSTRGGQPLELWYYAFDWAGADVPQVMEVLCTKEKDGQPGQVIEITLAAPSL